VFKIRSVTRIGDEELAARNLEFLGDTADWTYFVVPSDQEADGLRRAIDNYSQGTAEQAPLASLFDRITAIEAYGAEDRITPSLSAALERDEWPIVVDVVLWPSSSDEEARRRIEDVRTACSQYGAQVLGTDNRARTAAARVRCDHQALEALLGLTVVESIRLPLAPLLEPSSWLQADVEVGEVPESIDVVIGVIDDGITTGHPLLAALVVADEIFPSNRNWRDAGPHGTMVAGLAAYGGFEEAFGEGGLTLRQPVRLACVRVLEPDGSGDPNSTHLPSDSPDHEVVEGAIRLLHDTHGVRIFNLSLTDRFPYSGPHASVFTETIDRLSRELDVVVVVAAGNRSFASNGSTEHGQHALHDYPTYMADAEARLAEPAPSALAVSVGSLGLSDAPVTAHGVSHIDRHVLAGRNRPSPFSRSGPGITAEIKPEFAHYGGDLVWDGVMLNANDLGVGSVSLNLDFSNRLFRIASGTSFAAPRVAHIVARILDRYPEASANLMRALLAISASAPEESDLDVGEEELFHLLGLGLPEVDLAIDSGGSRVVMVAEGQLAVDSVLIHPVPVPDAFARGRSDRSISVALAYDPPVRRQRREYLAGRIKIDMFRNMSPDEIREVMGRQGDDRAPIPGDRRRLQGRLRPTSRLVLGSTLQARRWLAPHARSLDPDDGDTYYVVLTHIREAWADRLPEDYNVQRYALAVELWDRERTEIDLYNLVQNQVRVPATVRVRV
jgi:subtilisin family serine protease